MSSMSATARRETVVLIGVTVAMVLLLLVGWLVIAQAHLYFGVLWLPFALAALRRRPRPVQPVYRLMPVPTPPAPVRVDHRGPEQRAADQARFDRLALPREAS